MRAACEEGLHENGLIESRKFRILTVDSQEYLSDRIGNPRHCRPRSVGGQAQRDCPRCFSGRLLYGATVQRLFDYQRRQYPHAGKRATGHRPQTAEDRQPCRDSRPARIAGATGQVREPVAQTEWILRGQDNIERDYMIATCPFVLAVDRIYDLKYRYINPEHKTLFPEEIDTDEPYVIREALNNAIAHQDYTLGGQVNAAEYDDKLVFSNKGSFIPGNIGQVPANDAPKEQYRNLFLGNGHGRVENGRYDRQRHPQDAPCSCSDDAKPAVVGGFRSTCCRTRGSPAAGTVRCV